MFGPSFLSLKKRDVLGNAVRRSVFCVTAFEGVDMLRTWPLLTVDLMILLKWMKSPSLNSLVYFRDQLSLSSGKFVQDEKFHLHYVN